MQYANKEFDLYTKICTSHYCKKEYRTEEYFNSNGMCKSCGSELKLKFEIEESTAKKVQEKENATSILTFIKQLLAEMKGLEFPTPATLTGYNREIEENAKIKFQAQQPK